MFTDNEIVHFIKREKQKAAVGIHMVLIKRTTFPKRKELKEQEWGRLYDWRELSKLYLTGR